GQVKRINWNAVSAQPWSRIERMESKGLCSCRSDNFPDIDTHADAKQFQLVYQGDVHATVDVLQQLGHLRCSRPGNRNGAIEDGLVKPAGEVGGCGVKTADNLRNIAPSYRVVSWVFPLGRKSYVELSIAGATISRSFELGRVRLENWNQKLFRRPWI